MVAKRDVRNGFTLIELLVVLTILATLLTIAAPRYFNSIEKSQETTLKQNIGVLRETIDKYYGDRGAYPESLDDLVTQRYLRSVPVDPITGSNTTWLIVPPPEETAKGAVYDVRSGAPGTARDGSNYSDW